MYSCSDFADDILNALGIECDGIEDDPEAQANLCLAEIQRLRRLANGQLQPPPPHNPQIIELIGAAPKEIPPWFVPQMDRPSPKSRFVFANSTGVLDGPEFATAREAMGHHDCGEEWIVNLAAEDQTEWRRDQEFNKLIQWPIYWAEAVLKQLATTPSK